MCFGLLRRLGFLPIRTACSAVPTGTAFVYREICLAIALRILELKLSYLTKGSFDFVKKDRADNMVCGLWSN